LLLPVGKLAIARYRIVSGRGKKVTIEIAGTIHKEAAAIRAACNRKAQEEEQLNVLPFRRAV
jgi:hypothetical protein